MINQDGFSLEKLKLIFGVFKRHEGELRQEEALLLSELEKILYTRLSIGEMTELVENNIEITGD